MSMSRISAENVVDGDVLDGAVVSIIVCMFTGRVVFTDMTRGASCGVLNTHGLAASGLSAH